MTSAFRYAVLLLLLLSPHAGATTYYLSESEGNDINPGTSPEAPWRNLTRSNSASLQPGDSVLLKRGDVWREALAIRDSGGPGNRLTFGAYGEGDPPLILGADRYTEISSPGNERHEVFVGAPAEMLILNGFVGARKFSDAELLDEGDWFLNGGVVRFRAALRPDFVDVTTRQFGIVFENVSHVTVRDIDVRWAYDPVWLFNTRTVVLDQIRVADSVGFGGIFMSATDPAYGIANTIRRCEVDRQGASAASDMFGNSGSGIFLFGTVSADDNVIEECIVRDSRHEGIGIIDGKRNTITRCSVSGSGSSGIRLVKDRCSDNIIEYNESFGNCRTQDDRFGIDLLIVGDNNVVRFNYVHEQEEAPEPVFRSGGIRFDGGDFSNMENQTSTGNVAYYNLVYDEYVGINVFNHSNVDVFNNTVIDCTGYGIVIHAVSTEVPTGNTAINNLVKMDVEVPFFVNAVANTTVENNFYAASEDVYFFAQGDILDFAGWQATAGFDAAGAFADPLFVDPASFDFRLAPESPAVDAGQDLGLTVDFGGIAVPSGGAVDIGAHEFALVPEGEPEGEAETEAEEEGEGEGVPEEGEGASEGEGGTEGEAEPEGEAGPEGEPDLIHSADVDESGVIDLSELLRVMQLFQFEGHKCDETTEDGYRPGPGAQDCAPHDADFDPEDWVISLQELLRVVQLFNAGGYVSDAGQADGFAPL